MAIDLSGKYWRIPELEKKFDAPYTKILSIVSGMDGVIKVGMAYLIPDKLLPSLALKLKRKNKSLVSIPHASYKVRAGVQVIKAVIDCGFPAKSVNGDFLIRREHLPALKKAVDKIREDDGIVSYLRAQDIADLAKSYMEEAK